MKNASFVVCWLLIVVRIPTILYSRYKFTVIKSLSELICSVLVGIKLENSGKNKKCKTLCDLYKLKTTFQLCIFPVVWKILTSSIVQTLLETCLIACFKKQILGRKEGIV